MVTGVSEKNIDSFSVSDLSELPIMTAQDLRENWNQLSVIDNNSFRVSTSGGTIGAPKFMIRTLNDWAISLDSHIRVLETAGLCRNHRLLIALPFDLWCIGYLTVDACKEMGSLAIPVGVRMDDEALADCLSRFSANAILTTPSRWELFSEKRPDLCAKHQGLLMLLAGEQVTNKTRTMLSNLWRGDVRAVYGSEETDGLGSECDQGGGMHILNDRFIFEVKNSSNGDTQINKGRGELFVTSLYHQGTPLIRYDLGDFVEINTNGCSCGNKFPKINVFGKTGEVLFFRDATKVYGYQIQEAINEVFGEEHRYQAIAYFDDTGHEILELRLPLLLKSRTNAEAIEKVLLREHPDLADSILIYLLSIQVKFVEFEMLETLKGKEKRLIDQR